MTPNHTLRRVVIIFACTATLTACDSLGSSEKPKKDSQAAHSPRPSTTSIPSSLRDALRPGYTTPNTKARKSCPMFTTSEFLTMFGQAVTAGHHIVAEHTASNEHETGYLHCKIYAQTTKTPVIKRLVIDITLLRKDTEDPTRDLIKNTHFNKITRVDTKSFTQTPLPHPGFGMESSPLGFRWACGPYVLAVDPGRSTDYLNDKSETHATLRKAVTSSVRELCGTLENPTPEVTHMPYTAWSLLDAFGGKSPETYGILRPADMKPGPRQQAQTSTRSISPTLQGSPPANPPTTSGPSPSRSATQKP